ncbi:septal ring lytic transglycosylase RlpA family protein [Legionella quinlivanii]|uniref:septal ring lytic transglycosylase RlpA family protein n=1 Tax=Legionella quinlivanii TaxID=45073 RepID=UPI0022430774|nr:septal ring lytic transglycosylase RlpA family protein [Legionella quinlivanii]MCW8450929.1 septal ring lytic transglycosylase RlpA family protein [Legionella quinlivanii]
MRWIRFLPLMLLSACQGPVNTIEPPVQEGGKTVSVPGNHSSVRQKQFTAQQKDGAPPGAPPTRFHKVNPVYEPFSRYGNPGSYAVNGHNYEVMRSASGYKTKGIASWYGTKFHSRRTSSGDDYDMYAMTAAHKTLPLPTYVRVKNLENGREAVVKVNDRGPFHDDRVIDLSYAAASKLGLLPKGTAAVEIEALTVREPGKPHIAYYYVQAGAFNSQQLAALLREKLARITPSPVFVEKYNERFLVKVGPFAERNMTDNLKRQLAQQGVVGAFSLLQ